MMFYIVKTVLYIYVILSVQWISDSVAADECPKGLRLLCQKQQNCGECMLAHSCCHWCYDETNFNGTFRCDFKEMLSQCGRNVESNKESSLNVEENSEFTEIIDADDANSAIQIRPQAFKVTLRKGIPVNLTFTYKAAKNYPLELYYLGDLSYSMKSHLETLKNLGDQLGKSLEKLTKHYKLAYGSFLDKPGMPFIWMDKTNFENPCRTNTEKCEKTYLFKHSLNFTDDMSQFFEQVRNSKISANVDDLDGALEAILQILVCDGQFGWSEYSRKIILLSTDSLLHTEGDGILAGASEVNTKGLCLVNSFGDHTDPLKYDYPSLGQIKMLLREHKVNLIVAVTEDKIKPYKRMEQDILEQEAFVGVLEKNSSNILQLVKTGFYDFIRQVEFSANTSHAPELDIKFFGDCYHTGEFNATSGCLNVEEDVPINFKLEITLRDTPTKFSEQLFIKEKNINEDIEINLEYAAGNCKCVNYSVTREVGCENGRMDCGLCVCNLGWKGNTCSDECKEDSRACRKDEGSYTCSGRGECLCGQCSCDNPYTGKFCEFECPTDKAGKVCSGQGTCFEGVCTCEKGYAKVDCSCENGIDRCRLGSEGKLCNGKGECECNKCSCSAGYSGRYCEITAEKNFFCEKYENYVKDHFSRNETESSSTTTSDGEIVLLEEWKDDRSCGNDVCSTVIYPGQAERCLIDYCYHRGEGNMVHLGTTNKKCSYTAQAISFGAAIAAFLAIVLGGLIIILCKKIQIYKEERAEFKRFTEASTEMNEINPLYVSPISKYENPLAR